MSIVAKCPENPEHDRFITVAYVSQDWVVDPSGEWLDDFPGDYNGQVLHRPDRGNEWACETCGAIAVHVEEPTP